MNGVKTRNYKNKHGNNNSKHKGANASNRFKYLSFTERIGQIRVNTLRSVNRIDTIELNDAQSQSFFLDALNRWKELDCTQTFLEFTRQVNRKAQSLPLILYHKDSIIETIMYYLCKEDCTSREALLSLIGVLARDLRHEFYPFFSEIMPKLLNLIDPSKPEELEHIFSCTIFLFKFLMKQLITNVHRIYVDYYAKLLCHSRPYIRKFASESLAFLIRKVKPMHMTEVLDVVISYIPNEATNNMDIYEDGVSVLLFECIKGVQNNLHSCASNILPLLLEKLRNDDHKFKVISKAFHRLCGYARENATKIVWNFVLNAIRAQVDTNMNDYESNEWLTGAMNIIPYICIYEDWILFRSGERISNECVSIFSILQVIINQIRTHASNDDDDNAFEWETYPIVKNVHHRYTVCRCLLRAIFKLLRSFWHVSADTSCNISNDLNTLNMRIFESMDTSWFYRSEIVWYVNECSNIPTFLAESNMLLADVIIQSLSHSYSLRLLASLLHIDTTQDCVLSNLDHHQLLPSQKLPTYICDHVEHNTNARALFVTKLLSSQTFLSSLYANDDDDVDDDDDVRMCKLRIIIPILTTVKHMSLDIIEEFIMKIVEKSDKNATSSLYYEARIIECILWFTLNQESLLLSCWRNEIINDFKRDSSNIVILRVLFVYLHVFHKLNITIDVSHAKLLLLPLLSENLSSYQANLRVVSIRCIALLPKLSYLHQNNDTIHMKFNGQCDLPDVMEQIMLCGTYPSLQIERDHSHHARVVETMIESKALPHEYIRSLSYMSIGILQSKFTTLWMDSRKIFGVLCTHYPKITWSILYSFILYYHQHTSIHEQPSSELITSSFSKQCTMNKQLWDILHHTQSCGEVASRNQTQMIELFLNFMSTEYDIAYPTNVNNNSNDNDDDDDDNEDDTSVRLVSGARKLANTKLILMLNVFSTHFTNPNTLPKRLNIEYYDRLFDLLLKNDATVQLLALIALTRWKHAYINQYENELRELIANDTFRERLTLFSLRKENGSINIEHRDKTLQIIIRILIPKMLQRSSSTTALRSTLHSRRSAVLSLLADLEVNEIACLFKILLHPLERILSNNIYNEDELFQHANETIVYTPSMFTTYEKYIFSEDCACSRNDLTKINGFLTMLQFILSRLKRSSTRYIGLIFKIVLRILYVSNHHYYNNDNNMSTMKTKWKQTRKLCWSRIVQIFESYDTYVDGAPLNTFITLNSQHIMTLPSEGIYHMSAFLQCLFVCSQSRVLMHVYMESKQWYITKVLCDMLHRDDINTAVYNMILDIWRNLLNHCDNDDDDDDDKHTNEFWHSNVNVLLKALMICIQRKLSTMKTTSTNIPYVEVNLVARLSRFVHDQTTASTLLHILLPLIKVRGQSRSSGGQAKAHMQPLLRIINDMVQYVDDTNDIIKVLTPQLYYMKSSENRVLITQIFMNICTHIKSSNVYLNDIVDMLQQLTAMSSTRLDEYDFERRTQAYKTIVNTWLPTIHTIDNDDYRKRMLPLMYCIAHDMHENETSIRNQCVHALSKIMQHESTINDGKPSSIIRIDLYNVLKAAIRHVRVANERKSIVIIMRNMCLSFPTFYSHMNMLVNNNEDLDFFLSCVHIQLHRQRKAMLRLRQQLCMDSMTIGPAVLCDIILPIVSFPLYYSKRLNEGESGALNDECILLIGTICSILPWNQYYHLLCMYLKQLTTTHDHMESLITRLIANVLDNFHFELPMNLSVIHEDNDNDDVVVITSKQQYISKCLLKNVLPQLYQHVYIHKSMSDIAIAKTVARHRADGKNVDAATAVNEADHLRVPIIMAIVKLLKKLPSSFLHLHFPRLLKIICLQMNRRDQRVRDRARKTYTTILQTVGTNYLSYMLRQLTDTLKRGFQLHVLLYVTARLVDTIINMMEKETFVRSEVDICIPQFTEILMLDLVGEAGEAKEVEAIRNSMREAKKTGVYDTYQNIARIITFDTHIQHVIDPLFDVLMRSSSSKHISSTKKAIHAVVNGIKLNATVDWKGLLIYVYELLSSITHKNDDDDDDGNDVVVEKPKHYHHRMMITKEETVSIQQLPSEIQDHNTRRTHTDIYVQVRTEYALKLLLYAFQRF